MTSSTPASSPKEQSPAKAAPSAVQTPSPLLWWRQRWLEPIVVATVIISLVTALATGVVAEFQSVKGEIQASEARVTERIQATEMRIQASEARVTERIQATEMRIQASEARVTERIQATEMRIQATEARIQASETRLIEALQASEARQNKRIDDLGAEMRQDGEAFKTEIKAMNDKLDRLLETLLAAKS